MTYNERECEFTFAKNWWSNNGPRKLNPDRAKPILVCLMANAHYKTQTYRPTDNA